MNIMVCHTRLSHILIVGCENNTVFQIGSALVEWSHTFGRVVASLEQELSQINH